ncbi:MAG: exosome complex RNA-binding protein Csl4 [Thermoplasmata archaeon]
MGEKNLVLPSTELGVVEEFVAGEGTYINNGKIYSNIIGYVNVNDKERIISVEPIKPKQTINANDILYCYVESINQSIAVTIPIFKEKEKSAIKDEMEAILHISRVKKGYSKSFDGILKVGDIIRAKVVSISPKIEISIAENDLGVTMGYCSKCRKLMIKKNNVLYCDFCRNSEVRKLSLNYRDPWIL